MHTRDENYNDTPKVTNSPYVSKVTQPKYLKTIKNPGSNRVLLTLGALVFTLGLGITNTIALVVFLYVAISVALVNITFSSKSTYHFAAPYKYAPAPGVNTALPNISHVHTDHDAVIDEYADFLTDLTAVLYRPALCDVGVPTTQKFVEAYTCASDARRVHEVKPTANNAKKYAQAVSVLQHAWRDADNYATKMGVHVIPYGERKKVVRAIDLLNLALNTASTSAERSTAYTKALYLVDGIVNVPSQTRATLGQGPRLEITPF